jgi:hypothetical protein
MHQISTHPVGFKKKKKIKIKRGQVAHIILAHSWHHLYFLLAFEVLFKTHALFQPIVGSLSFGP